MLVWGAVKVWCVSIWVVRVVRVLCLVENILELIYENNKDSVTQNSKPVYEEHQQYKLKKNTWNLTRSSW